MMDIKAFNTPEGYLFRVHLDTTKTMDIPDQNLPAPAEGEPDTRPIMTIPDPDWVCEWMWGKEQPKGQTTNDYLLACKREAGGLAILELDRRQPPTEIVLP